MSANVLSVTKTKSTSRILYNELQACHNVIMYRLDLSWPPSLLNMKMYKILTMEKDVCKLSQNKDIYGLIIHFNKCYNLYVTSS